MLKKGQNLEQKGLFYSRYSGIVTNNEDPEKALRLQVDVPAVFKNQKSDAWALPVGIPSGKSRGFAYLPKVGENVWVSFANGDTRFPLWEFGAFQFSGGLPSSENENIMLWQTDDGISIKLDNENGEVEIKQKDDFIIKVANKIEITGGGESFKDLLDTFLDEIIALQVLTPTGTGKTAPDSITKLNQLKAKFDKLLK